MTIKQLAVFIGILSLAICLVSWALDLTDVVIHCIYCRSERTIIGLLGILLLLPIYPYLTCYLSLVLGFFGASVAAQQIMLIMEKHHIFSLKLPLALTALFFIIGQVFFIWYLDQNIKVPR